MKKALGWCLGEGPVRETGVGSLRKGWREGKKQKKS
jgi:hypothetical protein